MSMQKKKIFWIFGACGASFLILAASYALMCLAIGSIFVSHYKDYVAQMVSPEQVESMLVEKNGFLGLTGHRLEWSFPFSKAFNLPDTLSDSSGEESNEDWILKVVTETSYGFGKELSLVSFSAKITNDKMTSPQIFREFERELEVFIAGSVSPLGSLVFSAEIPANRIISSDKLPQFDRAAEMRWDEPVRYKGQIDDILGFVKWMSEEPDMDEESEGRGYENLSPTQLTYEGEFLLPHLYLDALFYSGEFSNLKIVSGMKEYVPKDDEQEKNETGDTHSYTQIEWSRGDIKAIDKSFSLLESHIEIHSMPLSAEFVTWLQRLKRRPDLSVLKEDMPMFFKSLNRMKIQIPPSRVKTDHGAYDLQLDAAFQIPDGFKIEDVNFTQNFFDIIRILKIDMTASAPLLNSKLENLWASAFGGAQSKMIFPMMAMQGYIKIEGELVSTTLKLENGRLMANGKEVPLGL